jgi:hypothetical protein
MKEVKMEKIEEVHLRMMEGMTEEEKRDFAAGLNYMGISNPVDRVALREAWKRLRPDASEEELEILVTGKAPQENKEWLQA